MTQYSFRTSGPDAWSSPRPYRDPSLRALAYVGVVGHDDAGDIQRRERGS